MRSLATITLALLLTTLLAGCDSIVEDTSPSTAISQEVALSEPAAIQGIRASMYDRMHSEEMSTDWLLGPAALADNMYFRGNQERHQGLNRNLLREGIGTLGARSAYDDLYGVTNDANLLISGIEDDVLPEGEANKLEAEGRFMRALALHHAVRIWGYDPDGNGGVVSPASGPGSGFTLGVEVRTEPTLEVSDATTAPRQPVPAVYDQIVSDLDQATSLFSNLSGDVREGSEFYPSQAAAQALLARVQLYQRNWGAANTAAQNAINLAGSTFGSALASADSASVRSIFDETSGGNPEAIFTISTTQTETAGINEALSAYTTIGFVAQLPTQDLVSLYEPGDARLAGWYDECFDEADDEDVEGCTNVNDPGYELTKYSSEIGASFFTDDNVHLRIAEMYLIQAEALLNTNGVTAAIDKLNELREARNASELDPNDFTEEQAYDEILDERRRELVAEGHRFFDLKRLGRDIAKAAGRDDIPFNSIKVLDDLPPSELEVNTELVQNPGY